MDDNPIPDGLDPTTVKEYIKGAFEDMGYLGRLIKVRGYCEDRSELVSYCDAAGIFLQNRGELHFFSSGFISSYIYLNPNLFLI